MLDAGEDPVEAVNLFKDRLFGVHFKDYIFDAGGNPVETVLGRGALNTGEFVKTLKSISFNECASIEYEGDEQDPVPNTRLCVDYLRRYEELA